MPAFKGGSLCLCRYPPASTQSGDEPMKPYALGDPRRSIQVELAKGHAFSYWAQAKVQRKL
jgi:hypothetical protein